MLGAAVDLSRPPAAQWTGAALTAGVRLYRQWLSPQVANAGVECRFHPSCSRYAEVAIHKHGALRGSWRTIRRLARCGPWTDEFAVDPP